VKTKSRCPGFLKRIEAMGGHPVPPGLFLPEETSGEYTNDVIFEKFTAISPSVQSIKGGGAIMTTRVWGFNPHGTDLTPCEYLTLVMC
jgi:hypothetical protein